MYKLLHKINNRISKHSHHFRSARPIDQFDRPVQSYTPHQFAHSNQSVPVPFRETGSPEKTTQNSIQDMEIYGHSVMGFGLGKIECQDSYSILHQLAPETHFFAVYDGHGQKGRDVSVYVSNLFASYLKKNADTVNNLIKKEHIGPFLRDIFHAVDRHLTDSPIDSVHSGTTCNAILISQDVCYISNLGDSRSVLCRQLPTGENAVIDLSQDHKPSRDDEQRRIIQMGGIVEPIYHQGVPVGPLRVWDQTKRSGLAMTRSLGDGNGKRAGIISDPEIQKLTFQPGDRFIIVGSDGLWDVMSSEEAASFLLEYEAAGQPRNQAPIALVNEAQKRWKNNPEVYCDDITVVIGYLDFNLGEEALSKTPMS